MFYNDQEGESSLKKTTATTLSFEEGAQCLLMTVYTIHTKLTDKQTNMHE